MNPRMVQITKKYILDTLNSLFFSNTVMWDGIDQFNQLPILTSENDKNYHYEQRGALLIHKDRFTAFRAVITVQEQSHFAACYRVANIKEPIKVLLTENLVKETTIFPLHYPIDVSVSDGSVGVKAYSAVSFFNNIDSNDSIAFKLVPLLLNSYLIAYEDRSVFEDLLEDSRSQIPYPGDEHYSPIFSKRET